MERLRVALAWVFGGIFLWAGIMKARDPNLFLMDIRSFDLLPDPYAAWLALFLPWMEILCGLAVITGPLRSGAVLLLNLSLLAFLLAIGSAWSRGIDIKCGCFGASDQTANYVELILRDVVLLVMGLVLSRTSPPPPHVGLR
jgi:putative oxidoreductase